MIWRICRLNHEFNPWDCLCTYFHRSNRIQLQSETTYVIPNLINLFINNVLVSVMELNHVFLISFCWLAKSSKKMKKNHWFPIYRLTCGLTGNSDNTFSKWWRLQLWLCNSSVSCWTFQGTPLSFIARLLFSPIHLPSGRDEIRNYIEIRNWSL